MHDFDVMEKKRTARGAFNKKCGSKSTRCTMPSDYLTPAEKKKLNGPVTEVKLNQPMKLDAFMELSDSLKVEYIKYLQDHYNANWKQIGRMMGWSPTKVCLECKRLGVKALNRCYDKDLIQKREAAWEAFCNGEAKQEEVPVVEQPAEELPVMELEKKVEFVAPEPFAPICVAEIEEKIEKMADRLDSIQDKLKQACAESPAEPKGFEMEAAKHVTQTSRLDMIFQGWPDEVTMTILRNMIRDQNVKVRISAEVVHQ